MDALEPRTGDFHDFVILRVIPSTLEVTILASGSAKELDFNPLARLVVVANAGALEVTVNAAPDEILDLEVGPIEGQVLVMIFEVDVE